MKLIRGIIIFVAMVAAIIIMAVGVFVTFFVWLVNHHAGEEVAWWFDDKSVDLLVWADGIFLP